MARSKKQAPAAEPEPVVAVAAAPDMVNDKTPTVKSAKKSKSASKRKSGKSAGKKVTGSKNIKK